MRLVDVAHRSSCRLTSTICGLSGATLLGTSLTSTHLRFARICPGDPGACQNRNALIYRYDLIDRRFELVRQVDLLAGFAALDDDHAIEVREPSSHDGTRSNHLENTSPPCELASPARLPSRPVDGERSPTDMGSTRAHRPGSVALLGCGSATCCFRP
jgi:hypothetical protein